MMYLFMNENADRLNWMVDDKLKLAERVERYLKHDGPTSFDDTDERKRRIELSCGRTIQYANRHVTYTDPFGPEMGLEDEVVWVGTSYVYETDEQSICLVGMAWREPNARINLIDSMTNDELERIVFATLMHESKKETRLR